MIEHAESKSSKVANLRLVGLGLFFSFTLLIKLFKLYLCKSSFVICMSSVRGTSTLEKLGFGAGSSGAMISSGSQSA